MVAPRGRFGAPKQLGESGLGHASDTPRAYHRHALVARASGSERAQPRKAYTGYAIPNGPNRYQAVAHAVALPPRKWAIRLVIAPIASAATGTSTGEVNRAADHASTTSPNAIAHTAEPIDHGGAMRCRLHPPEVFSRSGRAL
jgi:hypothetical protein